jgi:hypothetical protein
LVLDDDDVEDDEWWRRRRGGRRLAFDSEDDDGDNEYHPSDSSVGAGGFVRAANTVQPRSARPNAENDDVQGVQAFSERSDLNAPPSADDLQKLTRAILLYAQRPNKQIAIESSWGCTKGEGEDWQRASWLFDQAMSLDNKETAKQVRKGEVVRDDLQMEPLP